MEFSQLSSLLGVHADDERLIDLLDSNGIQRRPETPEFFKSPYEVSFFISKLGLMLYFQDDAYVRNLSPRRWGKSHLVLRSVVACSGIENKVKRYEGALPYGLDWEDTRTQARDKLRTGEAGVLHAGWRDCWWQADRYTIVNYQPGEFGQPETPGIFEVIQGLFLPSCPKPLNEDSYPDATALLGLLGKPIHSANFLNAFTDFGVSEWELDEHIDLRREYGVEIYLYAEQPLNSEGPRVAGINLLRDRLGPSNGWLGKLPLGMDFDMSIDDLIAAIGRRPDQANFDLLVWGWAKWFFGDYVLWVNFDSMRNRLESVALMARDYEGSVRSSK